MTKGYNEAWIGASEKIGSPLRRCSSMVFATADVRNASMAAILSALLLLSGGARAFELAVTFDDLPWTGEAAPETDRMEIARRTIDALRRHRVPQARGFVIGGRIKGVKDRAILKAWLEAGHKLGSHTYSHIGLDRSSAADYLADIRENEAGLQEAAPDGDWRWFRYPYLQEGDAIEKRRAVRAALAARGYRIAQVTLDFGDYRWNEAYARCRNRNDEAALRWLKSTYLKRARRDLQDERLAARRLFGREIKYILLLHLTPFTAEMLDALLDQYSADGGGFVSLGDADADAVYRGDPGAATKRGLSFMDQWELVKSTQAAPSSPESPFNRKLRTVCSS